MHTRTNLKAGALTVYGTDSCPWTRKQLDYLDKQGTPYTYVNCESGQCPEFVSAFPTLDQNGTVTVGFKEI
jgi:glutaredoxin